MTIIRSAVGGSVGWVGKGEAEVQTQIPFGDDNLVGGLAGWWVSGLVTGVWGGVAAKRVVFGGSPHDYRGEAAVIAGHPLG